MTKIMMTNKEKFDEALLSLDRSMMFLEAIYNPEITALVEHLQHVVNELKKIPRDEMYWSDFE